MKFSTQFKKSFSYTWYLYLLAIVVPVVLFPLSYSFMHRAKQNETLSIFVPCYAKENAEDKLFTDLKDLGIRKTEVIEADYLEDEVTFAKKISVVAYNRCDLIILPEEKLQSIGIETAVLELTSEVKELCKITDETIDESGYGVAVPKVTPINEIANLKENINYYAFIAAKSWNIGEYSQSKKHTENAFKFMQYVLGK
ncbi:MAG: hypothetical protein IKP50_02720 [Bacilli bacterium]|nr:hypothetical protein [Bacilli bacterium]